MVDVPDDSLVVEFSAAEAAKLLRDGINPARWERVREEIDFWELVDMLVDRSDQGRRGNAIRCPFHGRDSTPSFQIYSHSNNAYCWGCQHGDQFWDQIKFTARILNKTSRQALKWLEKEFKLPVLPELHGDVEEEIDESKTFTLEVEDLAPTYVRTVRAYARRHRDCDGVSEEVHEAVRKFFEAVKTNDPLPLARVLGVKAIKKLSAAAEARYDSSSG